jgi:hypothetical protein
LIFAGTDLIFIALATRNLTERSDRTAHPAY